MSHFNLAVFSHTDSRTELNQLLEPYNEAVDSSSPYAEFVKDEGSKFDETARATGYWCNPNAKWDWWEVGGRWRGMLRLHPGKTGYRVPLDQWTKDFVYPENAYDAAFVRDCDFSDNAEGYRMALRRWKVIVEGKVSENDAPFQPSVNPAFYLNRYGTKEVYAKAESGFSPYAFLTSDGRWFSQGIMGWFGCDNAAAESLKRYQADFERYLKQAMEQNLRITIVDCHI